MTLIAIAALTIDGKIARHHDHFPDWTSPEDKVVLSEILDTCDVVVVGNTTYKIAEVQLSKRNCIVFTRTTPTPKPLRDNLLLFNPSNASIEVALEPYNKVALLGGAQIYTYFMERGLIDELFLTIEPLVFGNGLDLFEFTSDETINFELVSVRRLNGKGSLILHYRRPL